MSLLEAEIGREYRICGLDTHDDEMDAFLLSLGRFRGEPITLVFSTAFGYIVSIKDARYSIDRRLAKAIRIE